MFNSLHILCFHSFVPEYPLGLKLASINSNISGMETLYGLKLIPINHRCCPVFVFLSIEKEIPFRFPKIVSMIYSILYKVSIKERNVSAESSIEMGNFNKFLPFQIKPVF